MIAAERHLEIGSLLYAGLDQIDLTGPFEVLTRIPNATVRLYGLTAEPVRDEHGLLLTPDATIEQAPALDVLHVPGGPGQQALMDDERVLEWLRGQAAGAQTVFSVCTGALLLGAAGLLVGRRATTFWAVTHLLEDFGATAVDARIVLDGDWVFAAGVTAGIDGALTLAASLRGRPVAEAIQLDIAYAPEPPFQSGTPATAPPEIVARARARMRPLTERREATARRIGARLAPPPGAQAPW